MCLELKLRKHSVGKFLVFNTTKKTRVKINNIAIEIADYTVQYGQYNVHKLIVKCLFAIPESALQGIGTINIYDNTPSHIPQDKSGGYYPPNTINKSAVIDIYLNQTLGHMPYISNKDNYFAKIKNWIFFILFGKLFIESTLFHEIGHHQYDVISPKVYKTEEEAEEDVKKYADELYGKRHPFLIRDYDIWNNLYHYLYKNRIEKAEDEKGRKRGRFY
jgi:hypothetical protein